MEAHVVATQGRIAISGEMNIYAAAGLKQQLFELVQSAQQSVELDLAQVSALDTSGLQLLLMLQRIAAAGGHGCHVVQASRAVQEVLNLCGLTKLLVRQPDVANE